LFFAILYAYDVGILSIIPNNYAVMGILLVLMITAFIAFYYAIKTVYNNQFMFMRGVILS